MRATLFLLVFVFSLSVAAQDTKPPFWDDIQTFRKQDSVSFPQENAILFVGSSSFTMWKDVQNDFPGYKIINRGFGGSSLPDVIRYLRDIVLPYQPKQIVIYCGENDLAASDTVTALTVFRRFTMLFNLIRANMPNVHIVFVSLKPSPSRWHLRDKMMQVNRDIKDYLKKQTNTGFVDVYHKMLGKDGMPMKEIFLEDELHMNEKGYRIWQKILKPYLRK